MRKIGYFYSLYTTGSEYPELEMELASFHDKMEKAEEAAYYEGSALRSQDFGYEAFRAAAKNPPQDPGSFTGADCTYENLILTYMAVANSMKHRELDEYHIVFFLADPEIWDESLEDICRRFHDLQAMGNAPVSFTFLSRGSENGELSPFEEYMQQENMYDGDAGDLLLTIE